MCSTKILSNTATIREVNVTEIDSIFDLKLNRERDIVSQLEKTQMNLLSATFLAIYKVNRDKLALINRLCERLTVTANLFMKIDQLDGFRPP